MAVRAFILIDAMYKQHSASLCYLIVRISLGGRGLLSRKNDRFDFHASKRGIDLAS